MIRIVCVCCWLATLTCSQASAEDDASAGSLSPMTPGVIYREYSHHAGSDQWRVTDEDATRKFPERAADFLPNPILEIQGVKLQHAIGAEITMDRWGGHRGTINKTVAFNGNDPITIPEIQNAPASIRPEMLMFQDNPTVQVPLDHLVEGTNKFQGDCDEAGGFGWGQWGLYSLNLRVYYDPDQLAGDVGFQASITSPSSGDDLADNPTVDVSASSEKGVVRVEVLARYDGFDKDGDGDHGGWHESRFQLSRGTPNDVRNHVGTRWSQPYRMIWDTSYIPDQPQRGIQMVARVQDSGGYWTVTQPVTDLTLVRRETSVKIYHATDVPEDFAVRVGETKTCLIPIGDVPSNWEPMTAAVHLRTWHGDDVNHAPSRINDQEIRTGGKNHHYDYDLIEFPPSALKSGDNVFSIHSDTVHHMLELLWPGPSIVVRYNRSPTFKAGDSDAFHRSK